MNKLNLANYNNSIVNLACSIKKYFDLDYNHNTLDIVDKILEKEKPTNVVVMLFDGMGSKLIERILGKNSFLYKNMFDEIFSVVPSTTTAATTSVLSGLTPKEHGWLGWDLYFKEEDKIVTMFKNTLKDSEKDAADYDVANKYYTYKTITEQINDNGKYYSKILFPFGDEAYDNLDDMFIKIKDNLNIKKRNYIYAYHDEPDGLMHDYGTESIEVKDYFKLINKKVEEFAKTLKDTLLIVIADHGHINSSPIYLDDYPDLFDILDSDIWIEGRMTSFKVKENMKNKFVELFNKYFSNDFILKTKEEIIKDNIFGDGVEHKYFYSSLGDFFSLAIGDKYFKYKHIGEVFKSAHAGFSDEEMFVPLIVIKE